MDNAVTVTVVESIEYMQHARTETQHTINAVR